VTREVRLRPKAISDADSEYAYLAARSLAAANRFIKAIDWSLDRLASFPLSGGAWKPEDPDLADIRVIILHGFPNHLVFYRVHDDWVEVIRILHGARDLEPLLKGS
jgi:toxin ParE1/3/4